jgi:hypothetical protein
MRFDLLLNKALRSREIYIALLASQRQSKV